MSDLENEKVQNQKVGLGSEVSGYWQDVENKVLDKKFLSQEFADDEFDSFSVKKNRRSFLKIMGFSVSALPLTGCIKIPVRKALPYINKQDNTIPGIANWYASTFEGNPILVKTREGRPIKVEGNDKSTYFQGGVGSRGHGSVFTLYDSNRLKMPRVGTQEVEWSEFDKALSSKFGSNQNSYIITPSIDSPSQKRLLEDFARKNNAIHIAYESISNSAIADANQKAFSSRCLNEYNFENADIVVSFGADFLGTWGQSVSNAKGYSKRRDANHANGMNRHYQVESHMSLTGSNADYRYTKSHADQKDILVGIHSAVTGTSHSVKAHNKEIVKKIAKDLMNAKGRCHNADMSLVDGRLQVDSHHLCNIYLDASNAFLFYLLLLAFLQQEYYFQHYMKLYMSYNLYKMRD
jgi:molybdopterin-containing oxidoreductase family iron-sulfur binding subunit